MNKMKIKITKKTKLLEVNNEMCHNYYYLIQGEMENDTIYRRFKFVMWFDAFDVSEYFEKDTITQKDVNEYANVQAYFIVENQNVDFDNPQEFYKYCNDTIEKWNKRA